MDAAKRGKVVRVFARPRPNKVTMNALIELAEAGAEVHGHPWLHAKCILTDTNEGWVGLVMTANFEERGLDGGFETGILLEREDAGVLRADLETWEMGFPLTLIVNKHIGDIEGDVTLWTNEELRKLSVRKKGETDLGQFEAKTFEEMDGLMPDFSKAMRRGDVLYHQQTFKWSVIPPKLPVGAKRISSTGDIPVYKLGDNSFVVVNHQNQMGEAREMASKLKAKIVAM